MNDLISAFAEIFDTLFEVIEQLGHLGPISMIILERLRVLLQFLSEQLQLLVEMVRGNLRGLSWI
jgi:hypothetical protein